MELLPFENYLVKSNDEKIVLTTHRLVLQEQRSSESYHNTIFVEEIVSIEKRTESMKTAFVIGTIMIVVGSFASQFPGITVLNPLTLFGVLFVLVHYYSRRAIVSITPSGGQPINFETGSMSKEEVDAFIHKVILARMSRKEG